MDEVAALATGLSAYEASYVVLAQRHGLPLVTEDGRLRREAVKHMASVSVSELPGDRVEETFSSW